MIRKSHDKQKSWYFYVMSRICHDFKSHDKWKSWSEKVMISKSRDIWKSWSEKVMISKVMIFLCHDKQKSWSRKVMSKKSHDRKSRDIFMSWYAKVMISTNFRIKSSVFKRYNGFKYTISHQKQPFCLGNYSFVFWVNIWGIAFLL